jgi:hypothetical protein
MTDYEKQFVGTWDWHINSKHFSTITLKSDNTYVLKLAKNTQSKRIYNAVFGDESTGDWNARVETWLRYKPHIRLYEKSSNSSYFIRAFEAYGRIMDAVMNGTPYYIKSITYSQITFEESWRHKAIWYRS